MTDDNAALITGLRAAREGLRERWGEVWAQLVPIQNDIDAVTAMLARYGYVDAVAEPKAGGEGDGAESPVATIPTDVSEAVAKLIVDVGAGQAARRYCEWLFKNNRVSAEASVRDLLEQFPPSLREHYNPDKTSAVETLRSQIKAWVVRGETAMTYEGGMVALRPAAEPTVEAAMERRTA
jgi:hypothetical protein